MLIVSQAYVPDEAAAGQYLHDVARELARRGNRVRVLTAQFGYKDPAKRYAKWELRDGVEVMRLPLASFGTRNWSSRLSGAVSFVVQALLRARLLRDWDCALLCTSPPLSPVLAPLLATQRRRVGIWVMDLNPDQAVAVGAVSERSFAARALRAGVELGLRRSSFVVTLDEPMARRLAARGACTPRLIPLWPLPEHAASPAARARALEMRARLGCGARRVIMYSGNVSAVHPFATFLEALRRCPARDELSFVCVGAGTQRAEVEAFQRDNPELSVIMLPTQPLSQLAATLLAADVHLVSCGTSLVGIVHPSKSYGIMAAGRPQLFLGPAHAPIARMIEDRGLGWAVAHGDVQRLTEVLMRVASMHERDLNHMGRLAQEVVAERFSRDTHLASLCELLEQ